MSDTHETWVQLPAARPVYPRSSASRAPRLHRGGRRSKAGRGHHRSAVAQPAERRVGSAEVAGAAPAGGPMCLWRRQSARPAETREVSVQPRAGTPVAVVAQKQERAASNGRVAGWSPADGANVGGSSNGRTRAFEARCAGSTPAPPAICGVGSRKARRLAVTQDGAGAVPVRHTISSTPPPVRRPVWKAGATDNRGWFNSIVLGHQGERHAGSCAQHYLRAPGRRIA